MRKKVALIGILLVFGMSALLTGCGSEKSIPESQADLAKNMIDKANDAVDKANQTNPDDLLNSIP